MCVPRDASAFVGLIERQDPDLVIVMLGSNDLLEGAGADRTAGRMEVFLRPIRGTGKPVLLIAPPPFQDGTWVQNGKQIEASRELARRYRELAEKTNCLFADAGEWDIEVTFDGVHFSEDGHAAFARNLEDRLRKIGQRMMRQ